MSRTLVWFRRDLRLADNPALQSALAAGHTPVPVYIHDPQGEPRPGAASDWWLHHSLAALQRGVHELGSELLVLRGDSAELLRRTAARAGADSVYWNSLYEPAAIAHERSVASALQEAGLAAHGTRTSLLREPGGLCKADGTHYRVFTPFWNALQKAGPGREPAGEAPRLGATGLREPGALSVDDLELLPDRDWDKEFYAHWRPGEAGAWRQLRSFLDTGLAGYAENRDPPAAGGTSRLSPHLHFGEISAVQIWHAVHAWLESRRSGDDTAAAQSFLREVAWRDFAHHLLHFYPHTIDRPLDKRYGAFPWRKSYARDLRAWQRGRTGIPIVDAGMRELWTSGWMHNRVRMLAASLLSKNLLIPWQEGAAWFLDTLVDADLANNSFGWQWTAGCGADAAPYFRIFNPVTQGERFDPEGDYVRRWVPELRELPAKWIHRPWQAPATVLDQAGVRPGGDYPLPIVDLVDSRKRALSAWEEVKRVPRIP